MRRLSRKVNLVLTLASLVCILSGGIHMSFLKSALVPAALLIAVTGCQAIYPTQFVPSSPLLVDFKNDSYNFKVVDLTPSSALEANKLWKYTPRETPKNLQLSSAFVGNAPIIRASTLGESDGSFLIAQVSENVSTFTGTDDLRNPPPSPARPYRIGVGDIFTVTVEAVTETGASRAFQRDTTVDYAGNIFLTDVGEVNVLGQTVSGARQIIADRFRDARLSSNASATVTGFESQKVLLSSPGQPTSFVPITSTPITLRDVYLQNSSGIDTDARRQIVVLRRDGQNYSIPGHDILRHTYGYDVFLRDEDEIQIFDELVNTYATAAVSSDVLALRRAEFEREEAQRAQERFEAEERRADLQDQRAAEAAEIARQNALFTEQQLEIARLNVQIAEKADARAELDAARRDREEARLDAAEARARDAEARAAAAEARAARQLSLEEAGGQRAARQLALAEAGEQRAARQLVLAEAGEQRAARQLALAELDGTRSDRAAELAQRSADLNEQNAGRDLARARIDLGVEEQDHIFLAGEVGSQQTINLPFDRHFTLAEAIFGGNGIAPITGDPSRVYVVRVKSSVAGSVESFIFHFDGRNLANTAAMTMFQMRPDDYVLVMPRAITNWSRFVTQLVPTLNSVVSAAAIATRP